MEGRVFENFQKNQKIFKVPKMPKIVPKSIQTGFELVWVKFFEKFFCPVFRGGPSFRKFFKKIEKFSKFQKHPKSFPKVSKRVLNKFWGKLFENFLPSFPWKVESSKISKKSKNFQNSKTAQNRSQNIQTCFELVLGQIFRKKFLPSVPWRVEFSKIFKKTKIFQNSKNAHNCSQKYPNVF